MKTSENYVPIGLDIVREKYLQTEKEYKNEPDYWLVYSPEIVAIINDYVASGKYPYNSDIEDLVQEKLFPDIQHNLSNRTFAHIVYNSQSYRHTLIEKEQKEIFEKKMIELGFCKLTKELIPEIVGTDRRFELVLNTTNFLGQEGKKVSEKRYRLKDWGERGFHWMDTRSTRKGYHIQIGQFIKELTK
jgi:hypothetical protein